MARDRWLAVLFAMGVGALAVPDSYWATETDFRLRPATVGVFSAWPHGFVPPEEGDVKEFPVHTPSASFACAIGSGGELYYGGEGIRRWDGSAFVDVVSSSVFSYPLWTMALDAYGRVITADEAAVRVVDLLASAPTPRVFAGIDDASIAPMPYVSTSSRRVAMNARGAAILPDGAVLVASRQSLFIATATGAGTREVLSGYTAPNGSVAMFSALAMAAASMEYSDGVTTVTVTDASGTIHAIDVALNATHDLLRDIDQSPFSLSIPEPRGAIADIAGNLLIVSAAPNQIAIFNSTSKTLTSWGAYSNPLRLPCSDASGFVFVPTGSDRMLVARMRPRRVSATASAVGSATSSAVPAYGWAIIGIVVLLLVLVAILAIQRRLDRNVIASITAAPSKDHTVISAARTTTPCGEAMHPPELHSAGEMDVVATFDDNSGGGGDAANMPCAVPMPEDDEPSCVPCARPVVDMATLPAVSATHATPTITTHCMATGTSPPPESLDLFRHHNDVPKHPPVPAPPLPVFAALTAAATPPPPPQSTPPRTMISCAVQTTPPPPPPPPPPDIPPPSTPAAMIDGPRRGSAGVQTTPPPPSTSGTTLGGSQLDLRKTRRETEMIPDIPFSPSRSETNSQVSSSSRIWNTGTSLTGSLYFSTRESALHGPAAFSAPLQLETSFSRRAAEREMLKNSIKVIGLDEEAEQRRVALTAFLRSNAVRPPTVPKPRAVLSSSTEEPKKTDSSTPPHSTGSATPSARGVTRRPVSTILRNGHDDEW